MRVSKHTYARFFSFYTLVLVLIWPAPGFSQNAGGSATEDENSSKTAEVGVSIDEIHDDNIFATRNNRESDFITVVSPFLTAKTAGEDGSFRLDTGASVGRYASNSSENYQDFWGGMEIRRNLGKSAEIFGGGRISRLHEDRASPDDVLGPEPTKYDQGEAFLGAQFTADRMAVRVGGTYDRLDFEDDAPHGTPANNDDRDRELWSFGARVGYAVSPGRRLFVQGASDTRRYDEYLDDNGQNRDSDGYNAAVGLEFRSGLALSGEVLAGYLEQNYNDPALQDVSTFDVGALVRWRTGPSTVLVGSLDRSLEETTLLDASSYLYTTGGGQISHRIRPGLIVGADAAMSRRDYQGVDRYDDIIEAGLGVNWYFLPNFFLGLDYRFTDQNSSLSTYDYDENRIFLRLGARSQPAFGDGAGGATSQASDDAAPNGLYIGAQASHNDLVTELAGPRGSGGTVESDNGDQGFGGGAFLGYGADFGAWYLGGELSADMTNVEYGHANGPVGRVWSVERGPSYAIEGRLGRTLEGGDLVYGRAGVVLSEFQTDYVRTMASLAVRSASQKDTRTGMRMGVGAEFPLTGNFFGRMEYVYTAYDDYNVVLDSPSGDIDNFANEEGAFRVGVGYRFGAATDNANVRTQHDFSGPYAAVQAGFGGLYTDNAGPRESGNFLNAERADHGAVGGVLAGAGTTFGPLYLGVEIDAELSDLNWNVSRSTDRVYSVERKESYGAGARLGVVVNDATLLYGRAGPVRTRFTTDYLRQDTGDHVIQDDRLTGWRFGGGVELPASDHTFLRLDYSYTRYGDYSVDYASGVDSFDNSEALVRLGVGFRY